MSLYPKDGARWWSRADHDAVVNVTRRLQPQRVLEFGPGTSTLSLIEGGAGAVDCCEDLPDWLEVYQERIAGKYPCVRMIAYDWADPLTIPASDALRYDMALIDGPRGTERRVAVIEYCLQRCAAVLLPLEEMPTYSGRGYLRPHMLRLAEQFKRKVELIESGPLSGTFALLTC